MAILIFFGTIVFGISTTSVGVSGVLLFWNLPSLILVLIPSVVAAGTAHSLKGVRVRRIIFAGESEHKPEDVIRIFNFFGTLGNSALLLGIIAFFISQILMLADLSNPNTIGPNMAMGLISAMYALCLKTIAYTIQCQVRKKVKIPHDMLNRDDSIWIAYFFAVLPMLTFFILLFAMSKSC